MHQCSQCHNEGERQRRVAKRSKHEHRRMAKALTQLTRERANHRLELLVGIMLHQFGGLQGFGTAWIAHYQRAMESGGFAALRCFQTVIRLLQYCDEKRRQPCELSDDELHAALLEQTKRLIEQQPEIALEAAGALGWALTPP